MATNSKIEWTDHTVNLWWGCSKVHTGCKNCYAEHLSDVRYKKGLWGVNTNRRRIKSALSDLNKYQRQAQESGKRLKIFMGSMMDIMELNFPLDNPCKRYESTDDVRSEFFSNLWYEDYPNLDFLFLTKRPAYIAPEERGMSLYDVIYRQNVWVGTSISDQETADRLVPELTKHKTANLFLSIEPMVGPIHRLDLSHINWVIVGGESGPNRRPFDLEWAWHIYEMCKKAGVPFFFKQIDKVRDKNHPEIFNDATRQFPKELIQ